MKQGIIHIGISGWSYREWKGNFYPTTLKSADYLSYYAKSFDITEINSTFYQTPRLSTVEAWLNNVPAGFKFCPKMNKYLTHTKRLKDPEEPLERFFNAIDPIRKFSGPVLIQLPPSLKFDYDKADYFFNLLKMNYSDFEFALEARNATWFENESTNLLTRYKITLVISEAGNRFPYAEIPTAKNIYLRFHGSEKLYASSYPDEVLQQYADKLLTWKKEGHIIWVFFNNTMFGSALDNAATLRKMMQKKR